MKTNTFKDNTNLPKKSQINFQKQDKKQKISNRQLSITLSDLQQLIRNIQSQKNKNQLKLIQIKQLNRYFMHLPFVPNTQINFNKNGMRISQQLLLKQLDNLLEQQQILQKQLDKCRLNFQLEVNNKLSFQVEQTQNHYSFLRNVWTKNKNNEAESQQRIQLLNMQVAVIKKNILQMLKFQKKQTDFNKNNQILIKDKNYKKVQTKINSMIQETQIYCVLKEKYEKQQMEKEEYKSILNQLYHLKEQNKKEILQKSKTIEKLQIENKSLKSELKNFQIRIQQAQKCIQDLKVSLIKENSSIKNGNYYCIKIEPKVAKQNSQNEDQSPNSLSEKQFIYQITTPIKVLQQKLFQSSKTIQQLIIFLRNNNSSQYKPALIKYQNPQYNIYNFLNQKKYQQNHKKDINRINSPIKYRRIESQVVNHPKFIRMNAASPKIGRQVDKCQKIEKNENSLGSQS